MLELNNVTKVFRIDSNPLNDRVALDKLTITINDGDFVTVIGGNGSGKTSLLNAVAGQFSVDEGNIILNGQDITHMREHVRARKIGRVFQDPMLGTIGDMMIEENLALASRRNRGSSLRPNLNSKKKEEFFNLLKSLDLDLENRLKDRMRTLSGGQRQSITLLMATMNHPELLLLDEHTAALDPKTAKKVMDLTNEIVTNEKLTTIMITHNMKDAIKYGNRLIMMRNGQVIFDCEGEEKKSLTVEDLIKKFSSENDELTDEMLLSR